MEQNVIIGVAVIALISLIVALVLRKKDNKEGFKKCVCTSTGPLDRVCQDTDAVEKAYDDGQLTESTNFPSRGWSKVSPGDLDYPSAVGCRPTDADKKQWFAWDFTDFGN
jgi:hypothetical protein